MICLAQFILCASCIKYYYSILSIFILDQFNNLDDVIFVDWSISVDSVVYTVVVNNLLTSSVDGDVELSMESTTTNFQLRESDTRKFSGSL